MRAHLLVAVLAACAVSCGSPISRLARRQYIIGTHDAIQRDDEGRTAVAPYGDITDLREASVVDKGAPPPPCGKRVRAFFIRAVADRFAIGGLGSCRGSERSVRCPTNYLPSYSKLFFELRYDYIDKQLMKLTVDVLGRGTTGSVTSDTEWLTNEDRVWLAEFFLHLQSVAECRSE